MTNNKSFLTPLAIAVCKALCNPLGIISSVLLFVSGLVLAALDFSCGILVLPLLVLDLLAVSVSSFKAKRQTDKFGIPILKFTSFFICFITAVIFALISANNYFDLFTIKPLFTVAFDSLPFPLSLINSGFAGLDMYALPLSLFFLAKAITTYSLSDSVRKNVPERKGFVVSAILLLIALALLVLDGIDRASVLWSDCGYELPGYIVTYTAVAVVFLTAVAVILETIKTIYTFVKLRK